MPRGGLKRMRNIRNEYQEMRFSRCPCCAYDGRRDLKRELAKARRRHEKVLCILQGRLHHDDQVGECVNFDTTALSLPMKYNPGSQEGE